MGISTAIYATIGVLTIGLKVSDVAYVAQLNYNQWTPHEIITYVGFLNQLFGLNQPELTMITTLQEMFGATSNRKDKQVFAKEFGIFFKRLGRVRARRNCGLGLLSLVTLENDELHDWVFTTGSP